MRAPNKSTLLSPSRWSKTSGNYPRHWFYSPQPQKEVIVLFEVPIWDWTASLKRALDAALAMVVFISPEAIGSGSVSREIECALRAKHLRGRLIPVVLRPAKEAPWILQALQPVRYESPGKTGQQIVKPLSQPVDVPQAKRSA